LHWLLGFFVLYPDFLVLVRSWQVESRGAGVWISVRVCSRTETLDFYVFISVFLAAGVTGAHI
jgi:hypothetical protein